jgi:hypothetical protein
MGPLGYTATAADGFVWAHWHMRLLLPMLSHGPIIFPTGASDDFVWAHWHMRLRLSIASHGPIGIYSYCCRWLRVGPLAICLLLLLMASYASVIFIRCTADSLGWAHWYMLQQLPMVSLGPIVFPRCAANALRRAHRHMRLLLPMALFRPVIFPECASGTLREAHCRLVLARYYFYSLFAWPSMFCENYSKQI